MNYGPLIFLAAFFALATSWFGLVLTPAVQVGHQQQTNTVTVGLSQIYPQPRPALARQGLDVYRANGCMYCHSQQVGQAGTVSDVMLMNPGTNQSAVAEALHNLNPELSRLPAEQLLAVPRHVLQNVERGVADAAMRALEATGATAELHVIPVGPDIGRGWGRRRTVAQDFLFDYPVMPGSQRVGPDLANTGLRLPDPNWHLRHLYAPRAEVPGSTMPPYRYLFEQRRIAGEPSSHALQLPPEFAPPAGYEIVPTIEAHALVAYMLSLRADAPLFETPMTMPGVAAQDGATNGPVETIITNTPTTNPR
jgi:cbb3-type cytochrome oxidase cytochrome c subunit